ncbi:bifunctional 4-hydroxy-2-oxoglutarate aldolase/2-dehydro-3-deoxy-phosphogluconate aldolase [Halobacillus fulvus]|nr:bifunctional 4-hydroxy-2-oxoglutarate aldolase/2-dehydro-3-deoxy-phosphogluconate aldolase [Halobacillus fulvus]
MRLLEECDIVTVIRRLAPEDVFPLSEALVEGGITAFEVTVDSENAYQIIRDLKKKWGDQALVGAGTVLDEVSARLAIDAGADFVFSPIYSKEVIQTANRYGVLALPGVLTPTEMVEAYQMGADAVKLFPASAFGPSYVKDMQGPLGHIPIIPTGGISHDNIQDYMQNGALAVGVGGGLVDPEVIHKGEFSEITKRARQLKDAAKGRNHQ